eukprot:SRR837773.2871.p2 GENE.SRR837773.2871~~SRR837773.2871.p2  ORF type:complete len:632 (-),score=248.05 SRR837773.2871:32-1852(-)
MAVVEDSGSEEQDRVGDSRRRRRVVVGAAAGVAAASAMVLWRSFGTCKVGAGADLQDSVVSLTETYPQELVDAPDANVDLDARKEWLVQASMAHDKLATAGPTDDMPESVRRAINEALQSTDPEEARRLVDKAMVNAVKDSKIKRKDLKDFMKARRRSLKKKEELSPARQEAIATCVFDALSATTTIAGIAANLNDAAKTCWGVNPKDLFRFGLHGKAWVHTNVCSVNVWAILGGMIGLSSTLASSSSDCAATLIPNVNALCATSITGIVTAVASMGGASTLIKAACHPKGWYHDIPAGAVPSNVGNNEGWIEKHPNRKAQYDKEMAEQSAALSGAAARRMEASEPAPARQLLFGGGKGSTATQCSVEIAGTMWALASAAMAINSAGNLEEGGACPPKNFLTGSEKPSNSILYRVPQAMCTIDASSAILGFLSAATYIQLAVVNCIDTLNLGAICGAGITGMMAAASGVAKAGSGLYVACDIAQKKPLKRTINFARNVDTATGGMLSSLMGGGMDGMEEVPFGRRLSDDEALMVAIAEEGIEELQKKFSSPHEALESIGIDLDNKNAPWRNATIPGMNVHDLKSFTALFDEPEKVSSLFGGACKSE